MERAEAGPCASRSAGGVNGKDEFKPLDFGYGRRKGITQKHPAAPGSLGPEWTSDCRSCTQGDLL